MNRAKTFEDLLVWQKAHQLVLSICKITKSFPKDETFGLTSQIKRASVSVDANIAEGFGRKGLKDKLRFYNISRASLHEVKYFLILANDLNYSNTIIVKKDLIEVDKMLNSYISTISKSI